MGWQISGLSCQVLGGKCARLSKKLFSNHCWIDRGLKTYSLVSCKPIDVWSQIWLIHWWGVFKGAGLVPNYIDKEDICPLGEILNSNYRSANGSNQDWIHNWNILMSVLPAHFTDIQPGTGRNYKCFQVFWNHLKLAGRKVVENKVTNSDPCDPISRPPCYPPCIMQTPSRGVGEAGIHNKHHQGLNTWTMQNVQRGTLKDNELGSIFLNGCRTCSGSGVRNNQCGPCNNMGKLENSYKHAYKWKCRVIIGLSLSHWVGW